MLKKLIPNLSDRTNYVAHYRNLQLHLSLRMKLTKIHKVLEFKESDWMKIYIYFNIKKKKQQKNKKKMLLMVLKKTFLS